MSLVEKGIENCHGLSSRPVESRVAAHSSRLSPSPCAYAGTSPALPSIGTEYPYQHVVAVSQNPSTLTKLRGGWSRLNSGQDRTYHYRYLITACVGLMAFAIESWWKAARQLPHGLDIPSSLIGTKLDQKATDDHPRLQRFSVQHETRLSFVTPVTMRLNFVTEITTIKCPHDTDEERRVARTSRLYFIA